MLKTRKLQIKLDIKATNLFNDHARRTYAYPAAQVKSLTPASP